MGSSPNWNLGHTPTQVQALFNKKLCPKCGKSFAVHGFSMKKKDLTLSGKPFLRRLCDGTVVHD